ncbi:MAG: Gfo/Idh/MocA family protein [Opitutales bacterium]
MSITPRPVPPAVALIGLGGYGQVHLQRLLECEAGGECRLVSAVAVPGTAAGDLAGLPEAVRRYRDFPSWLAAEQGRFDLCCLPTPIHLHADMTLAALRAGGSVLVEKPLASDWSEITRCLTTPPGSGRFVAVGFQDLYLPQLHALQQALLDNRHGRLRQIRILGQWPRADAYYRRNNWAGELQVEGRPVLDSPLNNAFAHFLMLALFLAADRPGAAAEVTGGEAELYRTRRIASFDTAFLRLHTRTGVDILSAVSHSGRADELPRLQLRTDSAVLEWRVWRELRIMTDGRAAEIIPLPGMDATRRNMFSQICRKTRGESAYVCPPQLAAAHSAAIIDLHASCRIADVPADLREPAQIDQEASVAFAGIDGIMAEVFATGRLPGEMGRNWARPAQSVSSAHSARLASFLDGIPRSPALVSPA